MEVLMSSRRHELTDMEWQLLKQVLPTGRPGPVRKDDRRIMNGIFFVLRSGIPWRDLPERYGPYTTCFNRYNRWSKDGTWARMMEDLLSLARGDDDDDPDGDGASRLETRMMDSSGVRVHKHGAGSRRDGEPREMGKSRAGLTTKVHVMTDGNATPVALHLTPGQRADCTQAGRLLSELPPGATVIADKAYGSDDILNRIKAVNGRVAIPPKANRKKPWVIDMTLYKSRNRIERFFGLIKEFRRVATRYDKRARNYLSTVMLTVTRYLLRKIARLQIIESTP